MLEKLDLCLPDPSCNGAGNITSHRLREYEVKKLGSPACRRLENVLFLTSYSRNRWEVIFPAPLHTAGRVPSKVSCA